MPRSLSLWNALRSATVTELALSSGTALVACAVLAKTSGPGSEIFIGMLLGLGCGLGFMAIALGVRRRTRG